MNHLIKLSIITAISLTFTACGGGGKTPPSEPSTTTFIDSDGDGVSDSDEIANGTNPLVNEIPIANAGADQEVNQNTIIQLDGSASHDDGANALTYTWSILSSPSGSTTSLNDIHSVNPSIQVDKVGTYTFSLLVNDGVHQSSADTISVKALDIAILGLRQSKSGLEPWVTGGTPETTMMIKDMDEKRTKGDDIKNILPIGDIVYFTATTKNEGTELWKSDGTEEGTVLVKDINPGNKISKPQELTDVNGTLFFSADDGIHGLGLWKSDGTEAGTVLVKSIENGNKFGFSPTSLTTINGTLFFVASDSELDRELWKSDGTTEGTVRVKDIFTTDSSRPKQLANKNGTLIFTVLDEANSNTRQRWGSDGTEAGTVKLTDQEDIFDTCLLGNSGKTSYQKNCVIIGDIVYYQFYDSEHGRELWKSDGTEAGTVMIKDITLGTKGSDLDSFFSVNDTLYFRVYTPEHGRELWKSDGTEAGTVMIKDINPGSASSNAGNFVNIHHMLYFRAYDGVHGSELWRSDGTETGTIMVKDIINGATTSVPTGLVAKNNTLYFSIWDGLYGSSLWKSDGTMGGTVMIKDIVTDGADSLYGYSRNDTNLLTEVNGIYYFKAYTQNHGWKLWKTDGTKEGTLMLRDNTNALISDPYELTNVNGTLFLQARLGTNKRALYKSDGTHEGTKMIKELSYATDFFAVDNTLFFIEEDAIHGRELWKSDGTPEGTKMVKDIFEGDKDSYINYLTYFKGQLYFRAKDGIHGSELWKSDGTKEGTNMVKDIATSTSSSSPMSLVTTTNTLYFSANVGEQGRELWKSDGTAEGTVLVKDINSNRYQHSISVFSSATLTSVGNTIYFEADDGVHGKELWKSDGTEAGTVMVEDANKGSGDSNYGKLFSVGGMLYFGSLTADQKGAILWKSNGTEGGKSEITRIDDYQNNGIYILPNQELENKLLYRIENRENRDFKSDVLYVYDGNSSTQLTQ